MNSADIKIPEHFQNPFVSLKWSWKQDGQASLQAVRHDGTPLNYVADTKGEKELLAQVAKEIEKQINLLIKEERDAGRKF
jgi:hypothetical protein